MNKVYKANAKKRNNNNSGTKAAKSKQNNAANYNGIASQLPNMYIRMYVTVCVCVCAKLISVSLFTVKRSCSCWLS